MWFCLLLGVGLLGTGLYFLAVVLYTWATH